MATAHSNSPMATAHAHAHSIGFQQQLLPVAASSVGFNNNVFP